MPNLVAAPYRREPLLPQPGEKRSLGPQPANLPAGYEVRGRKLYNPRCWEDRYIYTVLATDGTKWVTWVADYLDGGVIWGHYFTGPDAQERAETDYLKRRA